MIATPLDSCPYCSSRFVTRSIKVLRVENNSIALTIKGLLSGNTAVADTSNVESIYNVKCATCSRKYQCIYGSAAIDMFNDIKPRMIENTDRKQTIIDRLMQLGIEPKEIPELITSIAVPQDGWLAGLKDYTVLHIFIKKNDKMGYLVFTYPLGVQNGAKYSWDDVVVLY